MSFFVEFRVVDGDHPGAISIDGVCQNNTLLRSGMTLVLDAPVFSIRQSKYPFNWEKNCVPGNLSKLIVILSARPEQYENYGITIKELPCGEYDLAEAQAAVQATLARINSNAEEDPEAVAQARRKKAKTGGIVGTILQICAIYLFFMTLGTSGSAALLPVIPGLIIMLLVGGGLIGRAVEYDENPEIGWFIWIFRYIVIGIRSFGLKFITYPIATFTKRK